MRVRNHSRSRNVEAAAPAELARSLGLIDAFGIVVGRIIGSGIFRAPGPIMALVGCTSVFYGVWLLGGIATLLGAFCYGELVAMLPRAGGPYAYLRAAYGPLWAFLRGWAMFFVSETAAIVAVALVFAEYGNSLFTIVAGHPYPRLVELLTALAAIWILTAVNCYGVRLGGSVQNVLSLLKVIALGALVGAGFTHLAGGAADAGLGAAAGPARFAGPIWPERFGWAEMLAAGAAMRYAFFAFSGWEGATYVAEEVREPSRNLPLSIVLGITGVTLLFLAANSAYLYQLAPAAIARSKWVAADAMRSATGAAGGILVSLAVMLSTFGNVSAQVLVKARTWYAMARDDLFPAALARVHPLHRTPNVALVAQAAWASVLLGGAALAGRAYETVIDFFSFTSAVFNVSTFAAVWVLRRRMPDAPRPWRVVGYPATLVAVLVIQIWFMVTTAITAPVPSVLGAALTASGLLWYYREQLWRRGRAQSKTPPSGEGGVGGR